MGKEAEKTPEKWKNAAEGQKVKKSKEKKKNQKENGKKDGEEDAEKQPAPPPPPPEEAILKVNMHCEGCARTVRRSLKGFEGVEDVLTDCRTQQVVVKGRKAAEDPMKLVERVQKKSRRKVELVSPLPTPKAEPEKKEEDNNIDGGKLKTEDSKETIVAVLKAHMHCEACAQEIKKTILKMKGVRTAEPDLKSSTVTVTGTGAFDPTSVASDVHKRTGKYAEVLVKQEPAPKKKPAEKKQPKKSKPEDQPAEEDVEEVANDEKKPREVTETKGMVEGKKKKGKNGGAGEKKADANSDGEGEGGKKGKKAISGESRETTIVAISPEVEMNRKEYNYYPTYPVEYYDHPPQIFSDENPNACAVM